MHLFPCAHFQSLRSFRVPPHILVQEAAFIFLGILRPFHDHKQIEFLDRLVSWQLVMWILSMKYSFLAMT